MTRGIARYLWSHAATHKSRPSWVLHLPLLLAIFGTLLQLMVPVVYFWHLQTAHVGREVSRETAGFHVDTHAEVVAAAHERETQHDPLICGVCQSFSYTQSALHPQSLMIAAVTPLLGFAECVAFAPYLLSHACSDSRAPPPFVS